MMACEWQPIETAPRDGSDVIGFGNNFGDPTGAQGHHHGIVHWDDHYSDFMDSGESWSRMSYLTHWMPLPPPPITEEPPHAS